MSKVINYVLSGLGLLISVLPMVFRDNVGKWLDDLMYMIYGNDTCLYLADEFRYVKIVVVSIAIFACIFGISLVLIKISNRRKPRLLNIALIAICLIIDVIASMNVPHHYYRLYPDGYKTCEQ